MRFATALILVTMTAAFAPSSAFSDGPESQLSESVNSIKAFVLANPNCIDFTDQCRVCTQESGELVCSTPKIACIQKELSCTRSRLSEAEQK